MADFAPRTARDRRETRRLTVLEAKLASRWPEPPDIEELVDAFVELHKEDDLSFVEFVNVTRKFYNR